LVGVDHDVFRPWMVLRHERPFHGGGEVGAATAAKAGDLDLVDDLLRSHRGDDLFEGRVTTKRLINVEGVEIRPGKPLGEHGTAYGPSLFSHSSWSAVLSWRESFLGPAPVRVAWPDRGGA